jgi:chromosome segregation ATPase
MTLIENPLESIAQRITKKTLALQNDQNKIANLDNQIALYQKSKVKTTEDMKEKQAEIERMTDLLGQAKSLIAERDGVSAEMAGLVAKYSQFPWRADMPFEEKIESSNYGTLRDEKFRLDEEINRVVKAANKTYYRR